MQDHLGEGLYVGRVVVIHYQHYRSGVDNEVPQLPQILSFVVSPVFKVQAYEIDYHLRRQ